MLSKNIRVYVEILPSFAVEGGNDILQHPVHIFIINITIIIIFIVITIIIIIKYDIF